MNIETVIQNVSDYPESIPEDKITAWVEAVVADYCQDTEVTIRIVDEAEMTHFNNMFRKKNKPTNVLSFPFETALEYESDEPPILGDILICAPVVAREASMQNKTFEAHFAHMVVHGCLHCLGFDHETSENAEEMEAIEIKVLKLFNFSNPYGE